MKIFVLIVLCGLAVAERMDSDGLHVRDAIDYDHTPESEYDYWSEKASIELSAQLSKRRKVRTAKNIIMFLGDGMSIGTLTAARFYGAEFQNISISDSKILSFDEFPFTGLARTYCTDSLVADSGCSATAFLGGIKGNKGTIGVSGNVRRGHCSTSLKPKNRAVSIVTAAQRAGKATGIVTNTRITHASPAGAYAHVADRDWESDYDVHKDGKKGDCEDIAKQLVLGETGKELNVIMGGGRKNFIPKEELDPVEEKKGHRLDHVNLIAEWKQDKYDRQKSFAYVNMKEELEALEEVPDYLMGLFAYDHLDDESDMNPHHPTLEEMTEVAINVLKKNKNGYFLFVEGGKIDMAHHKNQAHLSLSETLAFSRAVGKALNMTKDKDTLIVVTSDHGHGMTFSGYSKRSDGIMGLAGLGTDHLPYAILNYATGPGYFNEGGSRRDMRNDDMKDEQYVYPSGVPRKSEAHGGEDVAVFARGPFSHIFSGSYEQNYIAHAMAHAANLTLFSEADQNQN